MRAVDVVVLLFVLVWTFMSVCQADDDCSVSCEDVAGTVRNEVTFTCSVSCQRYDCCITFYKFQYPEKMNDNSICREELHDSCDQRKSITCSFTPTTTMTETFRFIFQTTCGRKKTEFSVNIAGSLFNKDDKPESEESQSKVVTAAVGFSITTIIIIIIILIIVYRRQCCVFGRRTFEGVRQDANNSPENMTEQL